MNYETLWIPTEMSAYLNEFSPNELDQLAERAMTAARQAGEIVRAKFGQPDQVDAKGQGDWVTEVDVASEKVIKKHLGSKGKIGFYGEETGGNLEGTVWCVDPIDGTTNFLHGFDAIAISIALVVNCQPVIGVVYSPIREEMFLAVKGAGASLNGSTISVSDNSLTRRYWPPGFDLKMTSTRLSFGRC